MSDSIGASIHMGLGHVSVQRHAIVRINDGKQRLLWGKSPVRISWSGGNGHETVKTTNEFIRALAWATRIAQNLDVRDPMKLSDADILEKIPNGYSGPL